MEYNLKVIKQVINGVSGLVLRGIKEWEVTIFLLCHLITLRNCNNIGVAQIVAAASWSNNHGAPAPTPAATAVDAPVAAGAANGVLPVKDPCCDGENVQIGDSPKHKYASFLNLDGSVAIHAGMSVLNFYGSETRICAFVVNVYSI